MALNKRQFGIADNGHMYPQAHLDLQELANTEQFPESLKNFDPATASHEDMVNALRLSAEHHKTNIEPLANRIFDAMERDGVPQHPKIKSQYDRGMITAIEYAQQMLMQLPHH